MFLLNLLVLSFSSFTSAEIIHLDQWMQITDQERTFSRGQLSRSLFSFKVTHVKGHIRQSIRGGRSTENSFDQPETTEYSLGVEMSGGKVRTFVFTKTQKPASKYEVEFLDGSWQDLKNGRLVRFTITDKALKKYVKDTEVALREHYISELKARFGGRIDILSAKVDARITKPVFTGDKNEIKEFTRSIEIEVDMSIDAN